MLNYLKLKKILPNLLFGGLILASTHLPLSVQAAEPSAFSSWARNARIGGAAIWLDMTPAEMDTLLNDLAAQHVSVIEADSDLSNYLTDAEFNQELALMRTFVQKAHAHPNQFKVVWYYPALEVLTPNVATAAHSMSKDHPDWIQKGIDGTPNVFVGGSGQVFWVEPGMESAWMSPSSPYRDYFYARVARMANETGLDGIWADVPLYSDFGPVRWSDVSTSAMQQFQSSYPGAIAPPPSTPVNGNWNDLNWRKWIVWRHEELKRFIADAAVAARQNNPEFAFIVETLPTDYTMSTIYGLEGADLRSIEGVTHVWEVDTLSNNTAMSKAREDDWISYISMQKYIKTASGHKPAWSFAYGKDVDDAELVMAEILAAGNNPYELKVPEMTTTVGSAYRANMFGWIKANQNLLWQNSAAQVAVLYSPASRDFVDKAQGEGMYTTTDAGGDDLWWNNDANQSAYQRQYVAEYRGMVKLLVHNHIPFDALVKPSNLTELTKYKTILLPDLEAISDADAQMLRTYVNNGGRIIVTGANPGGLDQFGTARAEFALADVLGVSKTSALPVTKVNVFGSGQALYASTLLGKQYFTNAAEAATASATLLSAIGPTSSYFSSTTDRRVHIELSYTADGNKMMAQYVNFIGVDGTLTVTPTTAPTKIQVPANKEVIKVEITSPDNASHAAASLAYTLNGQELSFTAPVTKYAMVIVSLRDKVANNLLPQNDQFAAVANDAYSQAMDISAAQGVRINDAPGGWPAGLTFELVTPLHRTSGAGNGTATLSFRDTGGFYALFKSTAATAAQRVMDKQGEYQFTYKMVMNGVSSAPATVTLKVNQPATLPGNDLIARDDNYVTVANNTYTQILDIPSTQGVRANDTPTGWPAGLTFEVVTPIHRISGAGNGVATLSFRDTGGFYALIKSTAADPAQRIADKLGVYQFTYKMVMNGVASAPATVNITVN